MKIIKLLTFMFVGLQAHADPLLQFYCETELGMPQQMDIQCPDCNKVPSPAQSVCTWVVRCASGAEVKNEARELSFSLDAESLAPDDAKVRKGLWTKLETETRTLLGKKEEEKIRIQKNIDGIKAKIKTINDRIYKKVDESLEKDLKTEAQFKDYVRSKKTGITSWLPGVLSCRTKLDSNEKQYCPAPDECKKDESFAYHMGETRDEPVIDVFNTNSTPEGRPSSGVAK